MSNEIVGRDLEIGVSTEATRGIAESSVEKWLRNVSVSVLEKAEHKEDNSRRGVLEDMQGRRVVAKYIEGDIAGIAHVDAIGFLYASIYGKVTSELVSGSVYDHLFELKQDIEHQSLTIFAKDGDVQQLKFGGCVVSKLELTAAIDDFVRFNASIIGKNAVDDASVPAYDTEYDFIGRDINIKIASTEAGLSSATAIKAKDVTVSHDQGAVRDHVFGSYDPDNIYNAKQSIDGEFLLNFVDETYKDLFLGDDSKYMSITIEGEADLTGGKPTITYVFNNIQITDWTRDDGNTDELITQPIKFKAFYNETDGEASNLTLRNLKSSYSDVPSA